MISGDIKSNMIARHIRTGGLYEVQGHGEAKINDKWVPVIIYTPIDDRKGTYVRETEMFRQNFEIEDRPVAYAMPQYPG